MEPIESLLLRLLRAWVRKSVGPVSGWVKGWVDEDEPPAPGWPPSEPPPARRRFSDIPPDMIPMLFIAFMLFMGSGPGPPPTGGRSLRWVSWGVEGGEEPRSRTDSAISKAKPLLSCNSETALWLIGRVVGWVVGRGWGRNGYGGEGK